MKHQQLAIDSLTATTLPHVLRYSLRVRQAMAVRAAGLVIRSNGTPCGVLADMAPMARALQALSTSPMEWDKRLVADIHTLHGAGIHNVEDMLDSTRQKVLKVEALRLLAGKRQVKPKHQAAWHRVAHCLITGHPWHERGSTPPQHLERRVHRVLATEFRGRWPSNPTAWGTRRGRTDLHTLSGIHNNIERTALVARDTVAEYVGELAGNTRSGGMTSYRQKVQFKRGTTTRRSSTGYAEFLTIPQAVRESQQQPKQRQRRHASELCERYSHGNERIIDVVALASSAQQQQAIVQWAPCVQPGWQID
jgi:hypothetical protein